jgi:TIG domain
MEFDLSKPGEKKKLILAALLGLVAILFLWWTLFGFGSSTTPTRSPVAQQPRQTTTAPIQKPTQVESGQELNDLVNSLTEVRPQDSVPIIPEARRNIFAFYEPPKVVPIGAETPPPTPTPTPPVLLASLSPGNVYARTADFTLEVAGDKFTPELRIFVDGRELATKYRSPQQLSATVPAAMIANPGNRQIAVRSPDGRLYSLPLPLSVAPPPTPNYNYVGIISKPARVDIALVQEVGSKNILSVQRGDVLSGRFRVTSIADKELVMTDTNLKIKHTLAMTEGEKGFGSPMARPTPRVDAEDDEPPL